MDTDMVECCELIMTVDVDEDVSWSSVSSFALCSFPNIITCACNVVQCGVMCCVMVVIDMVRF